MPLACNAKKSMVGQFKVQGTPCPPVDTSSDSPFRNGGKSSSKDFSTQALNPSATLLLHPESERAPSISSSIKNIQALAALATGSVKRSHDFATEQEKNVGAGDRGSVARHLANADKDAHSRSFQYTGTRLGAEIVDDRELADRIYHTLASKSQQITDFSNRIEELERENQILTERLQYETAINKKDQEVLRREIASLDAKLEATTAAAAQLHAQQTAIAESQREEIESLRFEIVQLRTASSSIATTASTLNRQSEMSECCQLPSRNLPSSKSPQPKTASTLPDSSSRPKPTNRGRLPHVVRAKADPVVGQEDLLPAASSLDSNPPRRVLHSMDSPIRPALANPSAPVCEAEPCVRTVICEYVEDFDTNGVFYVLGRREDGTWENPAKTGRVAVYCEADARGKDLLGGECKEDVLERGVRGGSSACFALAEGWFAVWLGEGTRLRPSHYTIRNGGGAASALTGWILEARNAHMHARVRAHARVLDDASSADHGRLARPRTAVRPPHPSQRISSGA